MNFFITSGRDLVKINNVSHSVHIFRRTEKHIVQFQDNSVPILHMFTVKPMHYSLKGRCMKIITFKTKFLET